MIKELVDQLKAKVPSELKLNSTILLLGRVYQKLEDRVISLEKRQLQKGDTGEKGKDGRDGRDGKNGIDGRNGLDGKDGRDGKNGIAGKVGEAGKDGVSVIDVDIAIDDHLVVKLSDGSIIDAGEIPKSSKTMMSIGSSGNAWQIAVQTTAPSNPQLNDLWLDIS